MYAPNNPATKHQRSRGSIWLRFGNAHSLHPSLAGHRDTACGTSLPRVFNGRIHRIISTRCRIPPSACRRHERKLAGAERNPRSGWSEPPDRRPHATRPGQGREKDDDARKVLPVPIGSTRTASSLLRAPVSCARFRRSSSHQVGRKGDAAGGSLFATRVQPQPLHPRIETPPLLLRIAK
jgi:hypothetical protein